MKLYGSYTSPYVRQCRIVLAQTGMECELVETDHAQSAEQSPTCRVPFLRDVDAMLTDSASILRHLREQAGQRFFPAIEDFDFFLLVNTAMDSAVNLFLLERDGVTPASSAYLARQQRRVVQVLDELERRIDGVTDQSGDGMIRLGCFLSWALFRQRIVLEPTLFSTVRGVAMPRVQAVSLGRASSPYRRVRFRCSRSRNAPATGPNWRPLATARW